jgi:hypothetical protein
MRFILAGTLVCLSLSITTSAQATTWDSLQITINGIGITNFSETAEGPAEAYSASYSTTLPPDGFTSGTIYLTEPAGTEPTGEISSTIPTLSKDSQGKPIDVSSLNYSDALTITKSGTTFSIYFVSDGASQSDLDNFVVATVLATLPETGLPQDVSSYFFPKGGGLVIVQSDALPLPAALPLFASGLGALGFLHWRRKRKTAQSAIAA